MSRVVCVLKTNEGGLWAVEQMKEIRDRGHSIIFILPPGHGRLRRRLDELNICVVESEFNFKFRPSLSTLRGLLRLRRQLKSLRASSIFYHLYASALAVRVATVGMDCRRVHMVAGPLYLESSLIHAVERWLCRLDHLIIGGSEYTARQYRGIGMPADRLTAIPYGVDLVRFDPEAADAEITVDQLKFTAVMVAYFYSPKRSVHPGLGIKGHEILLAAWDEFSKHHPNSELILVGSGFDEAGDAHRAHLQRRWSHLSSVRWVPTVADVRPWYLASDLSISPSLSENHGAALEASAMKCPSIVSDAGALPEAIAPGQTGWVVRAGSVDELTGALTEALDAKAQGALSGMGDRARRLMQARFDERVSVNRVADLVLDSVNKP